MRCYTLAFSIIVHLATVLAFVIVPLVATDVLPEPRRAVEFIEVTPAPPPPPPPAPGRRHARPSQTANPDVAPTEAPERIAPESGLDLADPAIGIDDSVNVGVIPGGDPISFDEPLPPPPPPTTPILRQGGNVKAPKKIRDVAPVYPAIAQAARVQGVVILEAVIDVDGRVTDLRVLRSVPLLDQAAIDAVRQWVFTPTLLNNEPVRIVMTVTVAFQLQGSSSPREH